LRAFLLGATGTIGQAVHRALQARGYEIVALARSQASAERLARAGATVLRGDMGLPAEWLADLPQVDAVIQMACDFNEAMAPVERRLLDGLLPQLVASPRPIRFIYTGGCWLFGPTGDAAADESSPFAPLPAFAWMVPHLQDVLGNNDIDGIVIHPGMVYGGNLKDGGGGVLRRFAQEARDRRTMRVVGSEAVRWPLVHCDDLAELYGLALERALPGTSYLGVAIEGMPVGEIARTVARHQGVATPTIETISEDAAAREFGDWARGYACNQRLSGARACRELGWMPKHRDLTHDMEPAT
jgi:nucleoside-diphosphate-sugar epimerase